MISEGRLMLNPPIRFYSKCGGLVIDYARLERRQGQATGKEERRKGEKEGKESKSWGWGKESREPDVLRGGRKGGKWERRRH